MNRSCDPGIGGVDFRPTLLVSTIYGLELSSSWLIKECGVVGGRDYGWCFDRCFEVVSDGEGTMLEQWTRQAQTLFLDETS